MIRKQNLKLVTTDYCPNLMVCLFFAHLSVVLGKRPTRSADVRSLGWHWRRRRAKTRREQRRVLAPDWLFYLAIKRRHGQRWWDRRRLHVFREH